MMIVDLVDQDDFFEFIKGLGVPVEQGWTPQQCSQAALAWLVDQNEVVRTQFDVSIAELQEQIPVMLPEVRDALEILTSD
ncbi:MAG: hypothetical protein OIF55_14925 [Amphritea sp.]|nr:hypothetical protein [Amphritea sp.]